MSEVVLEYKRVNGDKSSGRICVQNNGSEEVLLSFESEEFSPMLYGFAKALQEHPDAQGVIQRTDRPGLVPYNLDAQTMDLFRTDPVAAVTSMSTPYGSPSKAVQRSKKERTQEPPASLRVGFDTLADAFGDELYSRLDSLASRVECPCCGIWNAFIEEFVCKNPKCQQRLKPQVSGRWAAFSTAALLATSSPRFYFPRAWNGYKPWVSREDLIAKYEQFQQEKKSCP
jgi:hypothetical protein